MLRRGSRGMIAFVAGLIVIDVLLACTVPALFGQPNSSGALVRRLHGHVWWVERVTWSPDSRYVASCSSDNTVQVWEAETGNKVVALTDFQDGVYHVAWSPDGRYLATDSGGPNSVERIWDVKTWKVAHELKLPSQVLGRGVAWSPDSRMLAVVGLEGVMLWEVATDQVVKRLERVDGASSPAWSPDGRSIAFTTAKNSQSFEGVIEIWQPFAGSSNTVNVRRLTREAGMPQRIAWSPDGKMLASTGNETIPIWEVASSKNIANLTGHSLGIESVDWSPDGKYLASASGDRTVKIWDVANWANVATYNHGDQVADVEWSPDGQLVASASLDHDVYLWKPPGVTAVTPTRP